MKQILTIAVIFVLLALAIVVLVSRQKNIQPSENTSSPSSQAEQESQSASSNQTKKISSGKAPNIPFKLPTGYVVHVFAEGISSARDLQFSPGGSLLVSSPSSGNVYALPDKNGDGVADSVNKIIENKHNPHGLAFWDGNLFVAETTKVAKYTWDENSQTASQQKNLFSLPPNNNHNRRTITFNSSGKMFISIGSTCNVCHEDSSLSATVLTADSQGNNLTVFAKGLRNAPFIQFNPKSGELWATEMGRDNLGDNIPPDEIDILKEGNDYGWPDCYGAKVADKNFNEDASCQNTESPVFEIPAHSAPLGLTFINSDQFPEDWQGDLLVAYHGSWNRSTPTGYKVVRLDVEASSIKGASDFITGFIPESAKSGSDALGRPVDLTFDSLGNLYLSDDKAGTIYIIQKT